MNMQKIGLGQSILSLLAGFVGWYGLMAVAFWLLTWLMSGPLFLLIFVIGVLLFPLAPMLDVVGIIFLLMLRRKYPFSLWLAWGVLAAYLFNFLASYIFPSVLSLSYGPIPADLADPNGLGGAYMGMPFFLH